MFNAFATFTMFSADKFPPLALRLEKTFPATPESFDKSANVIFLASNIFAIVEYTLAPPYPSKNFSIGTPKYFAKI